MADPLTMSIYWLIDIRPLTLIAYPQGRPFYCGMVASSKPPRQYLANLIRNAEVSPNRPLSREINGCRQQVDIRIMETIPRSRHQEARKAHWTQVMLDRTARRALPPLPY